MNRKNVFVWIGGIFTGVFLVAILAIGIPRTDFFKATLQNSFNEKCETLEIVSSPASPLLENTPAFLHLKTKPENFSGTFIYATESGFFDDFSGKKGALMETMEKNVSFSGGEAGAVLTIQAKGAENAQCLANVEILSKENIACTSLLLKTDPEVLKANQSAEIQIITGPENFNGTFLIQADSGKLQNVDLDSNVSGMNTKTLVTESKKIIYNGGKSGEKIFVKALGEKNDQCSQTLEIGD